MTITYTHVHKFVGECDKLFLETSTPEKHIINRIFEDQGHIFQVF